MIGLEAAKALYDLESVGQVSIVHRQTYQLSLDAAGGEIVPRRIEPLGMRVLGWAGTRVLEGLQPGDGPRTVPCGIAVFSIGIKRRDELARGRQSAEDVYAIGECAAWKGKTYGLIAPGVEIYAERPESLD